MPNAYINYSLHGQGGRSRGAVGFKCNNLFSLVKASIGMRERKQAHCTAAERRGVRYDPASDRPTEMRPRETFMAERRVGMGAWTDPGLPIIFVVAMAAS